MIRGKNIPPISLLNFKGKETTSFPFLPLLSQ